MTFRPLIIDSAQTQATGCFTFYTAEGDEAFTFVDADEAINFTCLWNTNRHSARFAYQCMVQNMQRAVEEIQTVSPALPVYRKPCDYSREVMSYYYNQRRWEDRPVWINFIDEE